jgi:cell division protease FtsH
MKHFSEKVQEEIDEEVCKLIDECLQEAKELLTQHHDKVENLSQKLLEKDSLDLGALIDILGPRPDDCEKVGDEFIDEYFKSLNRKEEHFGAHANDHQP